MCSLMKELLRAEQEEMNINSSNLKSTYSSCNIQFVVLGNPIGGFIPSAVSHGVCLSGRITNKFIDKIFRIHTSWNLNRIINLPFHFLWDKVILDNSGISRDKIIYFILQDGFRLAYSRNYLKHLRKKYRNCKLIFYFRDPVNDSKSGLTERWHHMKDYYDAGITFNRRDAEKLGLLFTDYWPCLLPEKKFEPENQSDIFFVGQAKDRLKKILLVYEKLKGAGLKCDFWISGVPENEQKYADDIHYVSMKTMDFLTYDEVLQHVMNTKCVLEILPFGQNYSSLRVNEALWYHNKLLTTNIEAPSEWFYHPEIVQVFSDAENINTEFISRPLSPEDEHRIYDNMNIGDWNIFADFIIRNVH